MTNWTYDNIRHKFVNAATGAPLTQAQLIVVRDSFLSARSDVARALVRRYLAGEITFDVWVAAFRHETALTHAAMYQLGAGGSERMTQLSVWTQRLQTMLERQIPYANGFIDEVLAGLVTPAQMEERAALYMGAAVESYERANADDWQIDLPYFPADGTLCLTNCRCSWNIETVIEGDSEVTYATWQTEGDDDVCAVCEERGNEWQRVEIRRARLTAEQRRTLEPAEMIG